MQQFMSVILIVLTKFSRFYSFYQMVCLKRERENNSTQGDPNIGLFADNLDCCN